MIPLMKCWRDAACFLAFVVIPFTFAAAQQTTLELDPAKTSIQFTLDASLHTVHGSFQVKQGQLRLDPASGALSGAIVVDARSGNTGNGLRDRKMHKDVIESEQYPEISFHPDRVTGPLVSQGKSTVQIHGTFNIHGVDRQIEVPAEVQMSGNSWAAKVRFTIPYTKWGMKNPSTLFLRVGDSVEIDFAAAGNIQNAGGTSPGSTQ
jgi:polyisoprenoid-binding protein YceI